MKYKKKPVIVEAFQMTRERRYDNSEWPNWLHMAWNMEEGESGSLFCADDEGVIAPGENLYIATLEGNHAITFGDYIIQGVQGEIYTCKPNIFELTYESVDE